MKAQKENQLGITLIALVISIIVMLILAGVSLNATVGENGIVTRAQEAAEMSKKSSIIEAIQTHLMRYNIDLLSGDKHTAAKTAIDNLIRDDVVDNCMTSAGTFTTDTTELAAIPLISEDGSWTGEFEYVVGKDEYAFNIYQDKDGMFKAEISDIIAGASAVGGSVTGGKTLVTSETFTSGDSETTDENEKGKYTIIGDANVIFANKVNGSFSIHVAGNNVTATVSIFDDMTLSNTGLQRSAIDIDPTCTLNLWIAEGAKVTVDSGYAEQPSQGAGVVNGYGAIGGNGGYAGIHCWKANKYTGDYNGDGTSDFAEGTYSTLNLSGSGTLTCVGGDASDGLGSAGSGDSNTGGGGGGGAGAGIGGSGGKGGTANPGGAQNNLNGCAEDGEMGEDCGNVNIAGNLTIYAYGGAGGSAISGSAWGAGTGGGGYPAAGIGGGGAGGGGGDHAAGAGGYTGGGGQSNGGNAYNGQNGPICQFGSGAGYFSAGLTSGTKSTPNDKDAHLGGQGSSCTDWNTCGGDGGVAGKGGNIVCSFTFRDKNAGETDAEYAAAKLLNANSHIHAFNGNMYTDETWSTNSDGTKTASYVSGHENPSNTPSNQLQIRAQNGELIEIYKYDTYWNTLSYHKYSFLSEVLGTTLYSSASTYAKWESGTKYNYLVRSAINNASLRTGYSNPTTSNVYGIGSGAGYIETSNGTYTVN